MGVIALLAGVLAGAVGALLPLSAYRLSVDAGAPARTTCAHCGATLAGWVALPARCRFCRRRLGPPAWATGVVAGGGAAMITYVLSPSPVVVLFVALVVVGTWLGAVDLACRRLPRSVVVATTAGAALYLFALAGVAGEWGAFGRALLGAAVLGLVYLGLYLLPGRGLGFGDVRLAVLLGLCLGYLGWRPVLFGALLPWLINGPVALVLLLLGKVSRTSRLPLGPAMLVGALLAIGISGLLNLEI